MAIDGAASAALTLNAQEGAKYFDEVGAPVLFEKMAMELLKCKPVKAEVLSMLVDMLLKEKKMLEQRTQQFDEDRASKLFGSLAGDSVRTPYSSLLAKLQVDKAFAKALLPHLKPDEEGYIGKEEWTTWLSAVMSPQATLNWVEQQMQLCVVPGWTEDFEARIRRAFDLIDKQYQFDGEVNRDELMSVMANFALSAKILFKELDCNSDGGVSITEWINWFKRLCQGIGPEVAMDRLEWIEECLSETQQSSADEHLKHRAEQSNALLEQLAGNFSK